MIEVNGNGLRCFYSGISIRNAVFSAQEGDFGRFWREDEYVRRFGERGAEKSLKTQKMACFARCFELFLGFWRRLGCF